MPVEAGLFAITVDFGSTPFNGEQRYIELRVRAGDSLDGYTTLAPRQLVRPAPEALRAAVAAEVPWSGLSGVPAGFADGVDKNSGGTVTSIAAGSGLSGGTITGSGTLAVDTSQVQSRVAGACAAGTYLRKINADGSVLCSSAPSAVSSITAGSGLSGGTITGSGTLAIAPGGVTAAMIYTTQVQSRIAGECAPGTYLRGINTDGSVVTTLDDPANNVGSYGSIAIGTDGLPVISYYDFTAGALKVAKCTDASCTGATITTIDDPANDVGRGTSIAIGTDGLPVISYHDYTAGTLKVAACVMPPALASRPSLPSMIPRTVSAAAAQLGLAAMACQ